MAGIDEMFLTMLQPLIEYVTNCIQYKQSKMETNSIFAANMPSSTDTLESTFGIFSYFYNLNPFEQENIVNTLTNTNFISLIQ